jgi:hypothetical protein
VLVFVLVLVAAAYELAVVKALAVWYAGFDKRCNPILFQVVYTVTLRLTRAARPVPGEAMYLQDKSGKLCRVDWEGIKQICHAFAHSAGTYRHCSIEKDENSYFGGTTYHAYVKLNKKGQRDHAQTHGSRIYYDEFWFPMLAGVNDFRDTITRLAELRRRTRDYNKKVRRDFFDEADNINRDSFKTLDSQLGWSQVVRDLGATALVVCAGPVGAGGLASLGLLTTGATIKAGAKVTDAAVIDTGVIGSAVVEFACEMTIGALGIGAAGAKLSGGGKAICALFVQAPAEAVKTVAGGGDLKQAGAVAAVEVVLNAIGHGIEKALPVEGFAEAVRSTALSVAGDKAKDKAKNSAQSAPAGASDGTKVAASKTMTNFTGLYLNADTMDEAYVKKYCLAPYQWK